MPARIYISYSRAGAMREATDLYAQLSDAFGPHDVLLDAFTLDTTEERDEHQIYRQVSGCQVVLVLLTPGWLSSAYMRVEIATALRLNLRVIPVVLNGMDMPRADELPDELRSLVQRNAISISRDRSDRDTRMLVDQLQRVLVNPAPAPVDPSAAGEPSLRTGAWAWVLTRQHLRAKLRRILRPAPGAYAQRANVSTRVWRVGLLAASAALLAGVLLPYAGPLRLPGLIPARDVAAGVPVAVATTPAPVPNAGTRFRDCPDDTCPWMVVIPAGSFTMGSPADEEGRRDDESPQHRVTIRQAFAVMETEVTVAMYRAFVAETARPPGKSCFSWSAQEKTWTDVQGVNWRNPFAARGFEQGDEHPVVCTDWADAQAFARWMSQRTGQPYRLLSEAEWEYAARAGSTTRYAFGTRADQLCQYGNVADERARRDLPEAKDWDIALCDDGFAYTAPVASYKPNAFGLFDMHGNAWEWVQDCYGPYAAADGDERAKESASCERRLLRGGAWSYYPRLARSAYRLNDDPASRFDFIGFRLARMLPPGS